MARHLSVSSHEYMALSGRNWYPKKKMWLLIIFPIAIGNVAHFIGGFVSALLSPMFFQSQRRQDQMLGIVVAKERGGTHGDSC